MPDFKQYTVPMFFEGAFSAAVRYGFRKEVKVQSLHANVDGLWPASSSC